MILDKIGNFLIKRNEWEITDLRINIPELGPGSDAINPHTQYSNPLAILEKNSISGIGAGFTLGSGNNLICAAIDDILKSWDGKTLFELADEKSSNPYDVLVNPNQIRWLSPNSGVNYQAVAVIVNTLIDWICKKEKKPAWLMFANIQSSEFFRFYECPVNLSYFLEGKDFFFPDKEIYLSDKKNIEAYHTTWIGSSVTDLLSEIRTVNEEKGIKLFKLKVGDDVKNFINKIKDLKKSLPNDIRLSADANQTMSLSSAKQFIELGDDLEICWLEEPFAPDNLEAFKILIDYKKLKKLKIEIVTGENCPSPHVAAALMKYGIDRFQADPCRMLGLIDIFLISQIARFFKIPITPHAGGSCLDEMSQHISFFDQLFNNYQGPALIENVGFCGKYMKHPCKVINGFISQPTEPGFLIGFKEEVSKKFNNYKKGITWLEL